MWERQRTTDGRPYGLGGVFLGRVYPYLINKYFLKQKINELNFIIPFPTVGATCGRPHQTVNFPPHKRPTSATVGATIGRPLQSNKIPPHKQSTHTTVGVTIGHPSPLVSF